ncbi:MAG: esterase [Deltaproteobacteria bacterium]|nr:MAG: esterase [Deltaproteobacteria bacterium]
MPRTKLKEQPRYEFRYDVVIQPRDINCSGHLGHDTLISLVHSARADLLRLLGFREMDLGDGQTAIIMSDLAVNYREEAFMFDLLRIESHAGEISRDSFRIFYRVTRVDKIIALVETGLFAFNYRNHRIVRIPRAFEGALNQYLAGVRDSVQKARIT